MARIPIAAAVLAACLPFAALAAEVGDLENDAPNQLEDAYVEELGRVEVFGIARFDRSRRDGDTLRLIPRVEWVPLERLQLTFGAPYAFGTSEEADRGEALFGGLFQLSEESRLLPAFALSVEAEAPIGPGRRGTETELMLIASKTLAPGPAQPRLHLNLGWVHNLDPTEEERRDGWRLVLGGSRLLSEDLAVVVNLVRESQEREQRDATILEVGLRHEIARGVVLGGAVGAGFGRDSPDFRAVVSLQFSLGGR